MSLSSIRDPNAVLAALGEFDQLGRDAFLRKYGFGRAREYFVLHNERLYDSKALLGAAHGFEFPDDGPLRASEFSGGEATVARKLRELGFTLSAAPVFYTSSELEEGRVYTRADLRERFGVTDATINTGIFQPAGHSSIWLFVTEKKTTDRVQYADLLDGDTLYWQGQRSGVKDRLIAEHEQSGLEVLLFYRTDRYQHPNAGFVYEGPFRFVSKEGERPASFVLTRAGESDAVSRAEAVLLGGQRFWSSAKARKAIEDHAMAQAVKFLNADWPSIDNVSKHRPYDLLCIRDDEELRVEVKGTTTHGLSVLLTRGEVEHARLYADRVALFVLHSLRLDETVDPPAVSGGVPVFLQPWVIEAGRLEPIAYQLHLA